MRMPRSPRVPTAFAPTKAAMTAPLNRTMFIFTISAHSVMIPRLHSARSRSVGVRRASGASSLGRSDRRRQRRVPITPKHRFSPALRSHFSSWVIFVPDREPLSSTRSGSGACFETASARVHERVSPCLSHEPDIGRERLGVKVSFSLGAPVISSRHLAAEVLTKW